MKITRLTPASMFMITFFSGLMLTWLYPYHISAHMDSSLVRITGISLLVCSLILNLLAYREFKKSHTPHAPFMEPRKLIVNGIFSLSRNPVYLALVLSQSGLAFVFDMMWLILTTLILWIFLHTIIIPDEETMLKEMFYKEYNNYTKRTRRWI